MMTIQNYRYILFDLGGTLIYFKGNWDNALHKGIQSMTLTLLSAGYKIPPVYFENAYFTALQKYYVERESELIEYTSAFLLRRLMAEYGYPSLPQVQVQAALASMYGVTQAHWHLEAETLPVLEKLAFDNFHLGLITNASDANDVNALVDRHNLRRFFDFILISANVGMRKPHNLMFSMAMDYWKARPEEMIMVGDTLGADIIGAQKAGIAGVWVTRRAHKADNRKLIKTITPDASIESLMELTNILDCHN